MTAERRNDLFYVCSLIEYIGRVTKNRRGAVVGALGARGIEDQLQDAAVNHCLSFEQVSDEVIEEYDINYGDFDTITGCRERIPSYTAIGKLYCDMIIDCAAAGDEVNEAVKLFSSFISDEISDFRTGLYCENPSYLECSYEAGHLLE